MSEMTYDQAMRELQEIVQQLQDDRITMDQLEEKVQRALALIQYCREKLRKMSEG